MFDADVLSLDILIQIDARSNIYLASGGRSKSGVAPLVLQLPEGNGRVIQVPFANGWTNCCAGRPGYNTDADGNGGVVRTDILADGNFSGIKARGSMFLAGVFVGPEGQMRPTPPRLDYIDEGVDQSAANIVPRINQVFFIGDGRYGFGERNLQSIHVPQRAEGLILGFVDGYNFSGLPAGYDDNSGKLSVALRLSGNVSPVPSALAAVLPAVDQPILSRRLSIPLALLGVMVFVLLARISRKKIHPVRPASARNR